MKLVSPLLLVAALALPSGATAELPMLIGLDSRTRGDLGRLFDGVDYPIESRTYIESALVGALHNEPHPTRVRSYYRGEGVPFISATSRRAGPCQSAELTAWFPDGSRPPARLNGRYCAQRSELGVLYRATRQRLRLLPDEETPPSPPPGTPPEPD